MLLGAPVAVLVDGLPPIIEPFPDLEDAEDLPELLYFYRSRVLCWEGIDVWYLWKFVDDIGDGWDRISLVALDDLIISTGYEERILLMFFWDGNIWCSKARRILLFCFVAARIPAYM